MNRNKDLARNTFIIFIGTICTKLVSFFLLPLYTGLLTTEEYGIVDLLTTLVSLVSPIISLQISQGVFRYLIDGRNSENEKKELISGSIFFIIVNVFIYLVLFVFVSPFINNNYKYYLATNVIASIFCDLFLQISRGLGNNKDYSIAGVITAIVTILFNILFLVGLHMKVNGMLIGSLIGYIMGIIYIFIRLKLYKYISIYCCKKNVLKKLLKYSLPLVPNQLSWWVFGMSDRVIVSMILGMSLTGILSVSYKFSSAYIMLYNIFNISWTESIALHINDEDVEEYFNKTFNIISNLFISLGIVMIAVMPFAFKILVDSRYQEALYLIPLAILASICQVIVGLVSVVYVSKNDTKAIANTAISAAIVNVVVHLSLIKYIGIYAAVVSTFASYFVFSIYRTIDVSKKYLKIKIDWKNSSIIIFILSIVLFSYYSEYIYLRIASLIIAVIFAFVGNRNSLKKVLSFVKNKLKGGKLNG